MSTPTSAGLPSLNLPIEPTTAATGSRTFCGRCHHPMHWHECGADADLASGPCRCRNDVATVTTAAERLLARNPPRRVLGSDVAVIQREAVAAALARVRAVVDEQAEDEGLWFAARTAPEAYLQQELRRLHAIIEEEAGR